MRKTWVCLRVWEVASWDHAALAFGLQNSDLKFFFDKLTFVTNSAVFEDNNAALTLTTDKNATPWNGHIEAKCHWFRSHVVDTVEIKKTDTNKQVADYLTNDIEADKFANARMMMCGWWLFALISKIVWN